MIVYVVVPHGTKLWQVTNLLIDKLKKDKLLHSIVPIQSTNKGLLTKKSEWIHEYIEEVSQSNNAALEAWLYRAKIDTKINQKK